MPLKLIDTHAHLDAYIRDSSIGAVIDRALESGVERIICCSTNPGEWGLYAEAVGRYPDLLSWQVGLHPSDISDSNMGFLDALPSYFAGDATPVAIGEIGMDFHRLPADNAEREKIKEIQRAAFRRQLDFARDLDVPVCVHARDAFRECVDIMKGAGFNFSKAVFHCFGGSADELRELNGLGGRASFTGIITYAGAHEMREAMLAQPMEMLMFETDCPYLAPVPCRGSRCEPYMLMHTIRAAAKLFEVSEEYVADISSRNAKAFFGL